MNINRNNYEEFFLLYVDNELSAADRNAVDLFVQENIDLKEELLILQQTVFKADAIIFDNKSSLLKEDLVAMQEDLLLYIDGELGKADQLNIEKLLKTDSTANKELFILQQTKLQPETIVFADKQSLYRKEAGRVIAFPWKRIAVAAILLGFGTWGTVSLIKNNNKAGQEVARGTQTKTNAPSTKPVENVTAPVLQPQQQTQSATDINNSTANTEKITVQPAQKNIRPVNNKAAQQNTQQQKENNNTVAVDQPELKKPSNNLAKPDYNNFNNNNRNKSDRATVSPTDVTIDNNSGNKPSVDTQKDKLINTDVNGYALTANFPEGDAENVSADEKAKKSKLGGFFRKVKRLVERTTNTQTGNGIKIAGFDIAIK